MLDIKPQESVAFPAPQTAATLEEKDRSPVDRWERQMFYAVKGYREGRPVWEWSEAEKQGFVALWQQAKKALSPRFPMPALSKPEGIASMLKAIDACPAFSKEESREKLAALVAGEEEEIWMLRDRQGVSAQKTYVFDNQGGFLGGVDFPNLLYFEASKATLRGLDDILALFNRLDAQNAPKPLLIRGVPEDRSSSTQRYYLPRRRLFFKNELPGVIDVPHRWFCLDIDKEPLPEGADLSPTGLAALAADVRSRLPEPLRSAECVYNFSGSTGIKKTFGVHLWFWNEAPVFGEDLKAWIAAKIDPHHSLQGAGIDKSLYSPDHPVFFSTPKCIKGGRLIERAVASKPSASSASPAKPPKTRMLLDPYQKGKVIPPPIKERRGFLAGKSLSIDVRLEEENPRRSSFGGKPKKERVGRDFQTLEAVTFDTKSLSPVLLSEAKERAEGKKKEALKRIQEALVNRFLTLRSAAWPLVGFAKAGLFEPNALFSEILDVADAAAPDNSEDNRRWLEDAWISAPPMWPHGAARPMPPKKDPLLFKQTRVFGNDGGLPRLVVEDLKAGKKSLWGLHWSLGTGKTKTMKDVVDAVRDHWGEFPDPKESIVAISPLQSLTAALGRRLDLPNYQDKDGDIMGSVAVTLNSIGRVKRTPTVLLIDEIEQVRHALAGELFVGQCRKERKNHYKHLCHMIRDAKIVLVGDAFLSVETNNWLATLRKDGTVLENKHHSLDAREWVEYECEADLMGNLEAWVKEGSRFVVGLNSIKQAKTLAERLLLARPAAKILCYHSKNTAKEKEGLENVNLSWKAADVVIYSPSVSSGVSFDIPGHFDRVALLWRNRVDGVGAEAFFQQAFRVRNPKYRDVHYFVSPQEVVNRKSVEEVEEEILAAIGSLPDALTRRLGLADALLSFERNGRLQTLSAEEVASTLRAKIQSVERDDFFTFLLQTREEIAAKSNTVLRDIREALEVWEQPIFQTPKTKTESELREFHEVDQKLRDNVITKDAEKTLSVCTQAVLRRLEATEQNGLPFETPKEAESALQRAAQKGDNEAKEALQKGALLRLAPGIFTSPEVLQSPEGRARFIELAKNPEDHIKHRRLLAALHDAEFSVKNNTWRHRETKSAKEFAKTLLEEDAEAWLLAVDPRTMRLSAQNLLARTMRHAAFRAIVGDVWNPDSWKTIWIDEAIQPHFTALREWVLEKTPEFRRLGLKIGLWESEEMQARAIRDLLEVMGFQITSKQRQRNNQRYSVLTLDPAWHTRLTHEVTAPAEIDEDDPSQDGA